MFLGFFQLQNKYCLMTSHFQLSLLPKGGDPGIKGDSMAGRAVASPTWYTVRHCSNKNSKAGPVMVLELGKSPDC